jgi:hypothetical protein
MATGRINKKVLEHIAHIINRFKKRSRDREEWYTKICIKARAKQR